MALILAIETGTDVCSVALGRDGTMISILESQHGRDHAHKLALFIRDILELNNIGVKDLDAIAVSGGPGSYTGLRIGVSTAKGLCYPHRKPLIAIDSLQSLANVAVERYKAGRLTIESPQSVTLCPMIDARRMEVYTQLFDIQLKSLNSIEAKVIDLESFIECDSLLIFGDGATKSYEIMQREGVAFVDIASSAVGLISIAEQMFQRGEFVDTAYYEPLYLKDFVAKHPAKNLLLG